MQEPSGDSSPDRSSGTSNDSADERRAASARKSIDDSLAAVEKAPTRDEFDRSTISRVILFVYAGVISAGGILFLFRGWGLYGTQDNAEGWKELVSEVSDLIKTAVLPIVTLVLGYYFGKSGKL
jgi:hypothetical protein